MVSDEQSGWLEVDDHVEIPAVEVGYWRQWFSYRAECALQDLGHALAARSRLAAHEDDRDVLFDRVLQVLIGLFPDEAREGLTASALYNAANMGGALLHVRDGASGPVEAPFEKTPEGLRTRRVIRTRQPTEEESK